MNKNEIRGYIFMGFALMSASRAHIVSLLLGLILENATGVSLISFHISVVLKSVIISPLFGYF